MATFGIVEALDKVEDISFGFAWTEPVWRFACMRSRRRIGVNPHPTWTSPARTDEQEFYQLLSYKDDVDFSAKLAEWEDLYNHSRPHDTFDGRLSYEILRETL